MPGFFKSITNAFHGVPVAGTILREVVRVADQATAPVQEPIKDLVNDFTGARKRENKRLDEQKAQIIRDAQQRIAANIQANQQNQRAIIAAEANAVRAAIENVERENGVVEIDVERIPNPFLAYAECTLGTTEEIVLMLQPNEHYDYFINLNPLSEAYLSYIETNINIDALRMLSEHNHPSINASKTELSVNTFASIDIAIAEQNFEKVKRIMLASIQLEGGDAFLARVRGCPQIHQPLINAAILRNDNGIVFGELNVQTQASLPQSYFTTYQMQPNAQNVLSERELFRLFEAYYDTHVLEFPPGFTPRGNGNRAAPPGWIPPVGWVPPDNLRMRQSVSDSSVVPRLRPGL